MAPLGARIAPYSDLASHVALDLLSQDQGSMLRQLHSLETFYAAL